jgi:PAS domain S-box-containing protein
VIGGTDPAAEELFGYAAPELAGRDIGLLLAEPCRTEHETAIRRYRWTGNPRVLRVGGTPTGRRKDGSAFAISIAVSEQEIGGQRTLVWSFRNLTPEGIVAAMSGDGSASGSLNEDIIDMMPLVRRAAGETTFISTCLMPKLRPVRISAGQIEHAVPKIVAGLREAIPRGERLIIETQNLDVHGDASPLGLPRGNYVELLICYGAFGPLPPDVATHTGGEVAGLKSGVCRLNGLASQLAVRLGGYARINGGPGHVCVNLYLRKAETPGADDVEP